MKINTQNKVLQIEIQNLLVGEPFSFLKTYYIKVQQYLVDEESYCFATNLSTGVLIKFEDQCLVQPVDATLEVK